MGEALVSSAQDPGGPEIKIHKVIVLKSKRTHWFLKVQSGDFPGGNFGHDSDGMEKFNFFSHGCSHP